MGEPLLLQGGMVMTPGGPAAADVLIRDGFIVGVGNDFDATDLRIVDCSGAWVGPGFVDLHVHFREPGQEWKEDIATGSVAAAAGGFTAVVAMPNTDPPIDSGHLARYVADRGAEAGSVHVMPAGCITMGRQGEKLAHLDELWDAGVRIFSDDGDTVADAGVLRRAMDYLAERGAVIAQHAVDPGLARGGHMHEGQVSSRLGILGIPAEAEEVIIARDLALTRLTGARYHVQHLTTAAGAAMVAKAKDSGLPVTAEVTPHHLAFDHRNVEETDPDYKMMPPLRDVADVEALREALRTGVIDAVATDHAPHAAVEKDVPFEHAPFGVTGLGSAAAAVNTFVELDAETLFQRMSVIPARIAGLPDHGRWLADGLPANLVVFDPTRRTIVGAGPSKSANSPFIGRELRGHVRATVSAGRLVFGGDG